MSQAVLSPNLTQKIPMGSVPNCRKEIADRYPIRWFKCKLKPPKKTLLKETLLTETLCLKEILLKETLLTATLCLRDFVVKRDFV